MKKIISLALMAVGISVVGSFAKAETMNCKDSDSGYKAYYYIKGTTSSTPLGGREGLTVKDACLSKTTLQEGSCRRDGTIATTNFECPNGCKDGACLESSYCLDSDIGFKNYYFIKGSVKVDGDKTSDKCKNDKTLQERLCNSYGELTSAEYDCPNGCEDGACISEESATESRKKQLLREKKIQEQCEALNEKIKTRAESFDGRKEKHQKVYSNLSDRLNKFADKFQGRGLDTTRLEADLLLLDEKITKFNSDYAAYISKMKESQTVTCGESQGQFRGKLSQAKTLLRQVHADAADIRTFFQTTIQADLKNLKTEGEKQNPND